MPPQLEKNHIGAGLRFRYLWDLAGSPLYDIAIGADVREYYQRAYELANGIFFPVSPDIHAPVYSCFLALLLKLGGSVPVVRAVQLFLNVGAWIAFYLLLKREERPVRVRLTFLAVAMLYPAPVFYRAGCSATGPSRPPRLASAGTPGGSAGAACLDTCQQLDVHLSAA